MLLTLSASSLRSRLAPRKGGKPSTDGPTLTLNDLPRFARQTLGLHGLNLITPMLAGADAGKLDALREAADKASCPILVLHETEPQPFGADDETAGSSAVERTLRVVKAAHRLGCNSIAVSVGGPDGEDAFENAIERLKEVLKPAEKMEVNILLAPAPGMTAEPDRLTELIKKVGGFRIGTFPNYFDASRFSDPGLYLRRLVPYASALTASCVSFRPGTAGGKPVHEPYDLVEYTKVVQAVGYTGTLAIEYRGEGDPVEPLKAAKAVLESVVGSEDVEPEE
jgi:sugar phosphate isomerase/epimerase